QGAREPHHGRPEPSPGRPPAPSPVSTRLQGEMVLELRRLGHPDLMTVGRYIERHADSYPAVGTIHHDRLSSSVGIQPQGALERHAHDHTDAEPTVIGFLEVKMKACLTA